MNNQFKLKICQQKPRTSYLYNQSIEKKSQTIVELMTSFDSPSKDDIAKQINKIHVAIIQTEQTIRKLISSITSLNMEKIKAKDLKEIEQKIAKIISALTQKREGIQKINQLQSKKQLEKAESVQKTLITPKKHQNSTNHVGFGFTSEVKTREDFDKISATNDQLYKQYEEIMQKYQRQKQTLNHQNQVVLNQWLQSTNHIAFPEKEKNKKNNFFTLSKTLIQELSKYESVEQYVNSIELIEHQQLVKQLKSNQPQQNQDTEKKWLKDTTKDYLLRMAELLKNQDDVYTDDEIQILEQNDIENIF